MRRKRLIRQSTRKRATAVRRPHSQEAPLIRGLRAIRVSVHGVERLGVVLRSPYAIYWNKTVQVWRELVLKPERVLGSASSNDPRLPAARKAAQEWNL